MVRQHRGDDDQVQRTQQAHEKRRANGDDRRSPDHQNQGAGADAESANPKGGPAPDALDQQLAAQADQQDPDREGGEMMKKQ